VINEVPVLLCRVHKTVMTLKLVFAIENIIVREMTKTNLLRWKDYVT